MIRGFNGQLREVLTRLYADAAKVQVVAVEAGLPADYLVLDGPLVTRWFSVVEEAVKRGLVPALLDRALRDYPGDAALLALRAGLPVDDHVLVVSAIDRYAGASRPAHELDWVRFFDDAEVPARRQIRDPSLWDARFKPELAEAERALRRLGATSVRVEGHMRLMTWFMVGQSLPRTRGFTLSCAQVGAVWSSAAAPEPCPLREARTPVGAGDELAVALSVTNWTGADVGAWVRAQGLPLAALVELSTEAVSKEAIRGAAHARGCAEAVVDAVRGLVRDTQATRVHLFAAAPAGLMLQVGHLWNALPPARLYEHAPPGYALTYSVAG